MLRFKEAHGSGHGLTFPSEEEVGREMNVYPQDEYLNIYGDDSLSDPTNWWGALGGMGIWMDEQVHHHEMNISTP